MADPFAPQCMMCGSEKFDADESEKRDENGREAWGLWTYCRPCDCWTEHPEPDAEHATTPDGAA